VARLLVGQDWYESIRPQSWRESDYEAVVLDQAPALFPAWRCVPFTETVEGEDGTRKKPDLALIDHEYRQWWVVEVELANHDLYGHVIPQVDVFRTGDYGEIHAYALHEKANDLDLGRLEAMILGEPPNVLVIVDSPSTNWKAPLLERRVALAVVEPFRGLGTSVALRLNGDQPEPHPTVLTRCTRNGSIRRLWKVHSPAVLPNDEGVLVIEYDGVPTAWSVVRLHDSVMLKAERGDILTEAASVDLVRLDDGGLAFMQVSISTRSRRRPL
jgi:hypothetical protein